MSLKISLTAMAYSKQKAEELVFSQRKVVQIHLLKILASPDNINANHWCKEVNAALETVNDAATNVKTPSGKLKPYYLKDLLLPSMDDPHSIHSQLESSAFPRDLYEVWFPSTVDAARFAQKALLAFEHGLRDLVVNAALSKPFTPDKRLTVEKITSFLKGK